jgi:cellulose synthase/poly-beta-1,6-N-acetylglucosamine synthase-like glycosyltransferase
MTYLEELDECVRQRQKLLVSPVNRNKNFEWSSRVSFAFVLAACSTLALIAIWLGYPALVWLISTLRRRRPSEGSEPRRVTFILATRDAPEAIEARIRNFLDTDLSPEDIEVVVAIDATSTAKPPAVVDDRVRIVAGDAPGGKASTLNAAVRAARNDTLVFSDSAQAFTRSTARLLAERLNADRNGAVSGQLVLAGGRSAGTLAEYYWLLERSLRRWEAEIHSSIGVSGSVYAMRRDLWKPLPAGLILDDLYIPMQLILAGWRVGYESEAIAVDSRRFATRQERGRKTRTLTGVLQLCAWMPAVLNPIRNPAWLQFVCHKLLRMLTPYLTLLCAAALGVMYLQFAITRRPVLIGTLVTAVLLSAIAPVRTRMVSAVRSVWDLQASIVVATWNAARGRWDVWVR